MACSKELRIPKQWLKYHDDIVKEPVDPKLFSQDALCAWLKDLELCHNESTIAKYVQTTKPYHLMRHQIVLLPNNELCRKIFTLWTNTITALFISDDFLEKLNKVEMGEICNAFQSLDEYIHDQFPRILTIAEMKQFLLQQKVNEKFIPHVIYFQDFSNNVVKCMLEHDHLSKEDTRDFWRRLVVMIALYYEGVEDEVHSSAGAYSDDVWTRSLSSAAMIWMIAQEITSEVIGKTTDHVPLLNELYFLGTFYSMVVNDIYSYKREMLLENSVCNLVQTFTVGKVVPGESEAVQQCVKILNEVVKVMYQKIEKVKLERPDDQDLWKLLDNIGMATAGWYYFHHYSPRYDDSLWRLPIVAVQDDELEKWRQSTDKNPMEEVKDLLINWSEKAKKISDAIISGKVNMHTNL
jgi:hypothetical protein